MKYLLALLLGLSGCKWHSTETTVAQTKNTGTGAPEQDIAAAVSELSGEYVCPEKIDANNMTIDFLGAGVQTNEVGHFVRLYYSASLCRDYLEIMRCNAAQRTELTCRDGKELAFTESTATVQRALNNQFGTTVNDEGLRDCWTSIAANTNYGCVVLGGVRDSSDMQGRIYAAEHFVDAAAPAGQKFFYLARPCVNDGRANELTSGNKNCSPKLYVSNVVEDLEFYSIEADIMAARQKVADIAARLNYMTEAAYRITLEFSQALEKYQTADIKRQRSKDLRQGVAMIAGLTVGAAGAIYTVGAGSIGSGLDAGQALGSAFADIIASADDYPKTCSECLQLRSKLIAIVGDIDGADLSADVMDTSQEFFDAANPLGGGSLKRGSGVIYQQALDAYEEALTHLHALQQAKGDYVHEGKTLAGSKGGPP